MGGIVIRKEAKLQLIGGAISALGLWGLLGYYGWAIGGYHMFGSPIALLPLFLVAAPVTAGLLYFFRGWIISPGNKWTLKSLTITVLVGTAVFAPILAQGLGWANRLLDPKATYTVQAKVDGVFRYKRGVRRHASESSKLIFVGWPTEKSIVLRRGTWEEAQTLHNDEIVELTVGDGLFGIPYVVDYRKLD